MTAMADRVCWVDEDWDRTNASDRVSRYGAYLRGHTELFDPWREATAGVTEDPGEFAIAALQVATGPIMSPGYVRWHARVLDYKLDRGLDPEPGRLVCSVTLATFPSLWLGSPWRRWPAWSCAGPSRTPPSPAPTARPGRANPTCTTRRRRCGRWSPRSTRPPGRCWPSWRVGVPPDDRPALPRPGWLAAAGSLCSPRRRSGAVLS